MTKHILSRKDVGRLLAEHTRFPHARPLIGQERGRCCLCDYGNLRTFDTYLCQGFILCGDHRYYVRHGRMPAVSNGGWAATLKKRPRGFWESDEFFLGLTCHNNREHHQYCRSEHAYAVLLGIDGNEH